MERLDYELAHHQNQISANALKQIDRDAWREQWTADRKSSLLASPEHREAMMENCVERLGNDEVAALVCSLIQPDQERRYAAVDAMRRRLTIEAGKVAESEAKIKAGYGYFDGSAY